MKTKSPKFFFLLSLLASGILVLGFTAINKEALAQLGAPANFQANPQTFTLGDSVRFSWSGVSGADYYQARAPSLGLNDWYRAAAGTETSITIPDTNYFPTGQHQIELRACTNAGSCSSSASFSIIVKPRIDFFSITPQSVESGSPLGINWKVKGAYDLQIFISSSQIVDRQGTSETDSFESSYTGFSAGSDVPVIFRAYPQGRRDIYNEARQVLRIIGQTSPRNPLISIPSNIIQGVSATAQWSAENATKYKVYSDFAPMWETSLTSFTWSGDYTRTWPQNPDGPDHWVYIDACNDRGNCVSSQRAYFRVYPLNYTVPRTSTYSSAAPSSINVYISKTRIIEGIDFAYLAWAADVSDEQTTYTIKTTLNKIGTSGTLEMGGATSSFWPETETAKWPTGDYSLTVTACNRGQCATSGSVNFNVAIPPAPTNLVLEFAPSSPYQGGYVGVNFSAKGQGINYFKIESDLPGLGYEQSWSGSGTLWDWGGFRTWDIKTTKDWLPGRHWVSLKACGQGLQCSTIRREFTINPPPLPAGPWIFASPKSMDETGGDQYASISWGAENPIFQYAILSDPFNNDKPVGPYGYEQDWETNEISIRTSWTSRVGWPNWWPVGRHWFYNRACNTSGCAESDVATIMSFANVSGQPLSYDLSNPPSNPTLTIPSVIGAGSRFNASWSAGGSVREYILHSDLLPKGGVSTGGGWSGGSTITSYEFQNTAFWPQGEHWAYIEACNYTTCSRSPRQTFRVLPAGSPPQNLRWITPPPSIIQGATFSIAWQADLTTRYKLHSNLLTAVGLPEALDVGFATSYGWGSDYTINWPPGNYYAYIEACNDSGQCVSGPQSTFTVLPAPPSQAPPNLRSSLTAVPRGQPVTFSWDAVSRATVYKLFLDGSLSEYVPQTSFTFSAERTSAWTLGGHRVKVSACNGTGCGPETPEISFTVGIPPTNPRFLNFPANVIQGSNFSASWAADNNPTSYRLFSDLLPPEGVDVGSQTSNTWGPESTITYPPGNHWAYFRAYNNYGYVESQRANFAVLAAIPSMPQGFNASRNPIHTNETTALTWNQPAAGTAPVDRYELNIPSLNINWQNLGRVFTYNFSTPYRGNHAISLRACNSSQCSEAASLAVPLLVDDPTLITSFTPDSTLFFNQSISFTWLAYGTTCKVVVDANPSSPLSSCSGTYTALASDFGFGIHSVYYQSCNSLGCVDSGRAGFAVILPAPTNLTISPSVIRQGRNIVLSWQAGAGAARYEMKAPGLHSSLNDWVDVGNITTFTLAGANTANFNTGEFTVSLRSCGLPYPNQSACSDPISVPFTTYGPYPRITVSPPAGGPMTTGIDRPDPFVIYPATPPTGEPEAVTYNFNFTINDSPAEDLLIAALIPANTIFDSADSYHGQAPRRCLFQGADFIYWDYWRGRTVPMGTNETLTFRLKPQFSGLLNAPQTVGVKIFIVSNYGEVYGQSNINWQAIDSQCLTVQPTKTLQEAGIELDLPSYFPEELRHPQKLFSGRTIKIPLENSLDIKKMRLELENQTIRGGQPKTTLLPKDKTLDLLKEQGQEPPEFIKQDVSFKIPENLTGGTYNLKLFSENQNLKDVNINIEGLTSKDLGYNKGPDYVPTQTLPYVVSRVERKSNAAWETVLSGDHSGSGVVFVDAANIFRRSDNWRTTNIDKMFFGNNVPPFFYQSDPNIAVFQDRFYLASLVLLPTNVPSSASSYWRIWGGALYQGCLADSPNCYPEVHLFKGLDGLSQADIENMLSRNFNLMADFPKIAIDRQNNIIYIRSSSNRRGFLEDGLFISRDLGRSFQEVDPDLTLPNAFGRCLPPACQPSVLYNRNFEVGPDSKIYMLGHFFTPYPIQQPALFRYGSNGAFEDRKTITSLRPFKQPAIAAVSTGSHRGLSATSGQVIAIDKSSGPYRGRIYIVWSEPEMIIKDSNFEFPFRQVNLDIFLTYSDDRGDTWSEPIKVNDDFGRGDQYNPSIDVDGNGIINIAFFDHRDNQDLAQFDIYYTFSQDGGRTFSRNLRVNQRSIPIPVSGLGRWGDYFDLVHGKTGKGISYVGYPCIDDSYNPPNEYQNIWKHEQICIDQIYTGATVPHEYVPNE